MGAGASALPPTIDKIQAQQLAGDKFDEAKFDAAAIDGAVTRDAFLKAGGLSVEDEDETIVWTSSVPKHDQQIVNEAMVQAALSLVHDKRSNFLGAEVKEKTSSEEFFIAAWTALNNGDTATAITNADQLLVLDSANEKGYYTRAVAYARCAMWRPALADYSSYLKLLQQTSGPSLANALYGRALCLAKLGKRALALKDLDECIRVGPEDEQVTDPDASLVPVAVIARFSLLHACPELRRARDAAVSATAAIAAAASSSAGGGATPAGGAGGGAETSSFEGDVWRVLATDLEVAVERCIAAGKTPLLLDGTTDKAVDGYYLYAPATLIEAKKVVLEVRTAGVSIEVSREELRKQTVHAMRWGHTLVVRMSNSAADFKGSYCAEDTFPSAVFEQPHWPSDVSLDSASAHPFAKVLRATDLASAGSKFHTSRDFRVVVTSTFKPDNYARLLADALPLEHLQAVAIVERASAAPLKLSAAHEMFKGRTAEADAIGEADQISLLAERKQAQEEERENALAKVK